MEQRALGVARVAPGCRAASILFTCTGNQARSPMAERLTQVALYARYGAAAEAVIVHSAGLQGPEGLPMQPLAVAELNKRGISGDNFTSRLITWPDAEHATLVLTATRRHRDQLVAAAPRVLRTRTFTLRELAWLLDGSDPAFIPGLSPVARLAALPAFANDRRGHLRPPPPESLDIADPMGRGRAEYRRVAEEIATAVKIIVSRL